MITNKLHAFARFPHLLIVAALIVIISIIGLHAAKAQATFPISINPGAYTGHYFLISGGLTEYKGSQTVQLAPGNYYLDTGARQDISGSSSSFTFTVDGSGQVMNVSNPVAAQASGSTLSLNNTDIIIDPQAYTGHYLLSSHLGSAYTSFRGFRTVTLVPNILYFLDTGARQDAGGFASSFTFAVGSSGQVSNISNTAAAQASGNGLTLNNTTVTVNPQSYSGHYLLSSHLDSAYTSFKDMQSIVLVPNMIYFLDDGARVSIPGFQSSFAFAVDSAGHVLNINNTAAAQSSGNTITLNNTSISVNPQSYTGHYLLSSHLDSAYTSFRGAHTIVVIPNLAYFFDSGGRGSVSGLSSSFYFSVDGGGQIGNVGNPAAARASGNSLLLNTVPVVVDPQTYTGQYLLSSHLDSAFTNFTGRQTVALVPNMAYFLRVSGQAAYFGVGLTSVTPPSVTLSVAGQPRTFLFSLASGFTSIIAGPTLNPSNGHTYYLLDRENWTDSENLAQTLGGHLVTINDQAENDWVYNSFSAFGGVERSLWLGFTDRDVAGTFVWTSGEPVTYTNWSVGQPNNGITASRGPEFFAHMWSPDFCRTNGFIPGTWNDYVDLDLVDGTSPLNGVVELEPAICIEGLVSRWKADGDATDGVGGNNGTLRDGVTFVPGRFGQAFRSGYVEVENSPSLETPTLSVSVWVRSRTPGSPGVYNYIVSKGSDGCWSGSYGLSTQGTGGLVFHIYAGDFQGAGSPDAGPGVWDGNWHHVVGTYDGVYVRLYVDGNEIGDGTPTSIQVKYDLPTSRKLLIGAYNNTLFYDNGIPQCRYSFNGDIDDVKIYNRALCAAEVQSAYSGSGTCTCPDMAMTTEFTDHAGFVANACNLTTIDFDAPAACNNCLAGNEFAAQGLTIIQRDGYGINVVRNLAPGGFGTNFVTEANVNSRPNVISSSIFVSSASGDITDNYDFVFTNPVIAAGLFVGNLGGGCCPLVPTTVEFLDASDGIIASEVLTKNHQGVIFGVTGQTWDNRVFYGVISDTPIKRIRVTNGSGDGDGITLEDIQFCSAPNNDNEAPAITCPANVNVGNDQGRCSANVSAGAATATDNVDGNIIPTSMRSDGLVLNDPYPVGTTTITWTATDAAGNSATCQQTVTVNDTQPPAISCPTDMTGAKPANACSAVVNYSTPSATDNCSTASVSCSPPSGASFPIGSTTVVCSATDAASNTASCSFTVSVINHEPSANAGGPYTVLEGGAVAVTASGDDSDGDSLAFAWDLDNNGSFETSGPSATFSAATLDGPGSRIVKVQVTDSCGASAIGQATVNVLNVAPTVGAITAPVDPLQVITTVNTSASFTDPGTLDTHTAVWNWGDGSSTAGAISETNGSGSASGSHIYTTAGVYTITLTVTDKDGGSGQAVFQYVVVYDPSAGFVTGGGWINSPAGAYTPDPSLAGRATFGFVSKYQHGATVPTGNTQFNFHVASMNFNSTSYDWLVIAGARAQYKGTGTINGGGTYDFMLTSIDGQINGGGGADTFRIKIWDKATGQIIYDNQMGAADDASPSTVIAGGSIVIHSN
jgi:hypothetical protein